MFVAICFICKQLSSRQMIILMGVRKACNNKTRAMFWTAFFVNLDLFWTIDFFFSVTETFLKIIPCTLGNVNQTITLSVSLMLNGRHLQSSRRASIYSLVVQFIVGSTSWQPMIFWSIPRYSLVTVTSFKTLRLKSPSLEIGTGSKQHQHFKQ